MTTSIESQKLSTGLEAETDDDGPSSRSRMTRILDALLTIASIGGALCIVLVICALLFNITLIMFKTGSMSPTIPAGSVAVVREIPADQAKVGDIVTVDRQGKLPVTHRVLTVEPTTGGAAVLTLKGDANESSDPDPYTAQTVRLVIFSIPGLATYLVQAGNPWVLGTITLAVTALVTWAFWPTAGSAPQRSGRHRDPHRRK